MRVCIFPLSFEEPDNQDANSPTRHFGVVRYVTSLRSTVTAVAGRIGDLGVGGLTFGGGISFITNQYDLACDNPAGFVAVTASSILTTASPTSYPDLYRSLRGEGNNFGIVTSFNLMTKPTANDLLWRGTRRFPEIVFSDIIKVWTDLTLHSAQDPKAGSWIAWLNEGGVKLASPELRYGAPDGNATANLAPFYNITTVSDSTKTRGLAAYIVDNEATDAYGQREVFYKITVKASYEVAQRSVDIFYDSIGALSAANGSLPVLIWQIITDGSLKGSTRNGGNTMSCDASGPPIHIIQLACSWANADDEKVY